MAAHHESLPQQNSHTTPETVVLYEAPELRVLGKDALAGSGIEEPEVVVLYNDEKYWQSLGGQTSEDSDSLPQAQIIDEEHGQESDQIRYLNNIEDLKDRAANPARRSWSALLSGEIDEVSGGNVIHPSSKRAIKDAGAELDRSIPSFHDYVKSGVDYRALKAEDPTGRYKFYHSFGDQEKAQAYLTEVVKKVAESGISMSTKSFDHQYDGVNIYTHHPDEMQKIIAGLYGAHQDAFAETEHFLQAPMDDVNTKHIGWVQEPEAGLGSDSHSVRMGKLGAVLDQVGTLDDASYRAACESAGVRPEAPWLLDSTEEARIKTEATKHIDNYNR